MAYQMLTRSGLSFWEVTSAMQNAIRKGDFEVAGYAMWELIPDYTPYLQKRLLVISAEDCYGIITKEILNLTRSGTEEDLTRALSLLCLAKKNRDADYFVCNLMHYKQSAALGKLELARELHTKIRRMDVVSAGALSAELFKLDRKGLWKMLTDTAMVYYPDILSEVVALNIANDSVSKPGEETIFVAKAIVLMWTKRNSPEGLLSYDEMGFDRPMKADDIPIFKSLDECQKIKGLFPEWAYNWHTYYGKYKLKRDAVHAIENDQKLLTPLEVNLFDDCTWNQDINACLEKWNPRNRRLPYDDGKVRPEVKYGKKE